MNDWITKRINDCFHVYSDGTRLDVLFETDEDKRFMMNLIPIAAHFCGLRVICPEVMDTHFHVIVRGHADKIEKFKREIKRLLVRYFRRDGRGEIVKNSIWINADAIQDEDELRRKIIYVLRNCTEAGFPLLPDNYPWGPGKAFFQADDANTHRVSDLSYREACKIFRTRIHMPENWEYNDMGILIPRTYMDMQFITKSVFTSTRQFIAFLNARKSDLTDMESADARAFMEHRDESKLREETKSRCQKQFNRPIKQLTKAERIIIAKQLWDERCTFSIKQLARVTNLNADVLRVILHQRSNDT